MYEQIDTLVKLQEIEAEIAKKSALLEEIPSRVRELESRKDRQKESAEAQGAEIDQMRKRYRGMEADSSGLLDRIARSKARLNESKSNKEYQSSLKEIEDLERKHSALEDEMLQYLDRIEDQERNLREAKLAYKALESEIETEIADLKGEAERVRRSLLEMKTEVDRFVQRVSDEMMEIYRRVKKQQPRGIAVAQVEKAVCRGCNMNIPPQLYNELQRRDQLYFCPNCQRIIYWQNESL